MRRLSLALVALLTLAACDSGEELTVGGRYSTVFDDGGGATTTSVITIPETEDGDSFTFSAQVTSRNAQNLIVDTSSASGTGSYAHPRISLTADDETVTGTVGDGGATLTLIVEFDDAPIVFRRL